MTGRKAISSEGKGLFAHLAQVGCPDALDQDVAVYRGRHASVAFIKRQRADRGSLRQQGRFQTLNQLNTGNVEVWGGDWWDGGEADLCSRAQQEISWSTVLTLPDSDHSTHTP